MRDDAVLTTAPDPAEVQVSATSPGAEASTTSARSVPSTRRCCISPLPELTDLHTSLVEYGVPDFLSANAASDKIREELRKEVENAIRRFETRFQTVSVTLVDSSAEVERTLRFRIAALMYAEPAPEYVSFDSSLNPGSRTFSVSGGRDG